MKQFCRLVKTHTFLTCLVLAAVLLASIIIGIGTGPVALAVLGGFVLFAVISVVNSNKLEV